MQRFGIDWSSVTVVRCRSPQVVSSAFVEVPGQASCIIWHKNWLIPGKWFIPPVSKIILVLIVVSVSSGYGPHALQPASRRWRYGRGMYRRFDTWPFTVWCSSCGRTWSERLFQMALVKICIVHHAMKMSFRPCPSRVSGLGNVLNCRLAPRLCAHRPPGLDTRPFPWQCRGA